MSASANKLNSLFIVLCIVLKKSNMPTMKLRHGLNHAAEPNFANKVPIVLSALPATPPFLISHMMIRLIGPKLGFARRGWAGLGETPTPHLARNGS